MLALGQASGHYWNVESIGDDNPEPEPSDAEPIREELKAELKTLEAWIAIQKPGLDAAMDRLSNWIDKYISDQERAREIRQQLGLPPETEV